MKGYPKIHVGAEYVITANCWKGWSPGDVVIVTALLAQSVSVRCENGDLAVITKSSFRAMFTRRRGD